MIRMPEYVDGCLELYRIIDDTTNDYPEEKLQKQDITIWYREISVFDRTKYEFEQGGKEITMKICIPRFDEIDSKCVCEIAGKMHLVYSAASTTTRDGFKETELTLIRPGRDLKTNG